MREEGLRYIETQRVGVIAVEMLDGSPHAATVHFAHSPDPFELVVLTERKYRKFEPLLSRDETRASFVIGTEEKDMKTVQMDGILLEAKEPKYEELYRRKFTDLGELDSGNDVFIVFKPTWWRFTNWTLPEGKTVFNSDGSVNVIGS